MITRKLPISYASGIAIGLAFGFLWAFQDYLYTLRINQPYRWKYYLPIPLVNYIFWGLLLPVVYFFVERYPMTKSVSASTIFKALGISILVAFFHETVTSIIYHGGLHFADLSEWNARKTQRILRGYPLALFYRFFEYWVIFIALTVLDLQQKYKYKQQELAQLEKQLADAQINAIRGQFQPHFLFNTLNTVSSLMEIDTKSAQKVVSKLGTVLRSVLEKNKSKLIPLQEELEFIINYLDIEQVRFQDRLKIIYNIESKAKLVQVPSLILQPLVANAIQHGTTHFSGESIIEVIAKTQDDRLILIVKDNGSREYHSEEEEQALQRLKERLDAIYNGTAIFKINTERQGTEIILELPRNSHWLA